MKFFTLDCYHSWHSDGDSSPQTVAFAEYNRYLEAMQGLLPDEVLTLAKLPGVDDGLVVEVQHDHAQHVLKLILRCGHLQMGYYDLVLRYEEAEMSLQDEETLARIARTTKDDSQHESDLYFHEVDRMEDGRIEHRLLFHPGVWFAIRCRALHWERVPRPNQKLPPLRDRFPGGPTVATTM
jgi:hypothetical protein